MADLLEKFTILITIAKIIRVNLQQVWNQGNCTELAKSGQKSDNSATAETMKIMS